MKSGSVDVVSAFSVVHHIYQSDFLFKEVFRVLKPGGIFFADNDPNKLSTEIHDLNKQSALFRFLMGFYYLPLRFSKSFRERTRLLKELNKMLEMENKAKYYEKVSQVAEFHLDTGLDPYEIEEEMQKDGFVNVQTFPHFRGKAFAEGLSFKEALSLIIKMACKPKWVFPIKGES